MKLTEIKALIDKAIGKRGLIRTPAWWVRKIFYELIDWVTSSLTQSREEIQQDVDKSLEKSLPYISVYSSDAESRITLEGKTHRIPQGTMLKIPYRETFKFSIPSWGLPLVDYRGAYLCPKDLSHLFESGNLYNLDLSPLDTSEATDMSYMFAYYSGDHVKFGKLNMANVKDMSYMFKGSRFQSINRTGDHQFHYTNLEKAVGMYEDCTAYWIWDSLTEASDKVDYTGIFRNCTYLQHINPSFSQSLIPRVTSEVSFGNVVSLKEAFKGCKKLTRLAVSGTVSAADGFESMFEGCEGLTYLYLRSMNTYRVTSLKNIFKGCTSIEYLYLNKDFFRLTPEEDMEVDFSDMTKWVDSSVKVSLIDNLYTRSSSDLAKGGITIRLSQETYNVLTEDQLTTIVNKGYNVFHS